MKFFDKIRAAFSCTRSMDCSQSAGSVNDVVVFEPYDKMVKRRKQAGLSIRAIDAWNTPEGQKLLSEHSDKQNARNELHGGTKCANY